MSLPLSDTDPRIEAMQLDLLRNTPVWRKLQIMGELNASAKTLAITGLRVRHPQADEAELQRRLADLLLGEKIAAWVCGPFQEG